MLLALLLACNLTDDTPPAGERPTPMQTPAPVAVPPKREHPLPEGSAIVRSCGAGTGELYGGSGSQQGSGGLGARGTGQGGGGSGYGAKGGSSGSDKKQGRSIRPSRPKATAPSAAAPAAPTGSAAVPTESDQADAVASSGADRAAGNLEDRGLENEALPPPAAPAADVASAEPAPAAAPAAEKSAGRAAPEESAKSEATAATPREKKGSGKSRDDRPGLSAKPKPRPPEVKLDWGAVTWLSNDDSMSLASAQRLLWALQNRGPVKTSEIRPHELLNYFSFDTSPVPAGDTFSVLAAAQPTGDGKLTLAMAVKGTMPERTPLDLTLVLDRSGSMWAEGRMDYLKRGLTRMQGGLERGDRIDLVLFDNEVCTPLENYVVGRDDPALLAQAVASLTPRGSTDLGAGLLEGYRIANARTDVQGRNRRLLLISDALLNEGQIDPDVVSEIGRAYETSGIRLSAIGVGREMNDTVLDKLTEKGKGAYVYLGSEAVVDRIFGPGFRALTETLATDVRFALDLPESLAIERFYGEESSTVKADVQPISYFAGTSQLFLQDVAMRDGQMEANDRIVLTIEWNDPVTGEPKSQPYTATVGELLAADARNVHKGRALMAWTDLVLARSLGNDPCGAPYSTWDSRVRVLGADAEIAWLDELTAPLCDRSPTLQTMTVATTSGVPYKVRVDADTVIAEVALRCDGQEQRQTLNGNIANFSTQAGSCEVVLMGAVPMVATVKVPSTGGDVRCVARGGRLACT